MTFATLAIVAAVVVILVLVGLVLRLHMRLQDLTAEVRHQHEPAPPPAPADGPVAVITRLGTDEPPEDATELTTGRVVSVTFAGPMIKLAAFSHGIRLALDDEHRARISYAFRKELKRQRKLRRKAAAARQRVREVRRP